MHYALHGRVRTYRVHAGTPTWQYDFISLGGRYQQLSHNVVEPQIMGKYTRILHSAPRHRNN